MERTSGHLEFIDAFIARVKQRKAATASKGGNQNLAQYADRCDAAAAEAEAFKTDDSDFKTIVKPRLAELEASLGVVNLPHSGGFQEPPPADKGFQLPTHPAA